MRMTFTEKFPLKKNLSNELLEETKWVTKEEVAKNKKVS